ncbi:thiamine phosphate synthase [Shewanella algidipiscicola]|uniref:hydroxymethylpyrimidine kinase n=1 Tax=Shewanella algidipiscicola TaxID=614070 RepID=A0ABQ4PKR5_9GAMM|nr:thiamine phosphate synthase [Shewanella algidipiscicola]GIU48553.1 bifunctional hydroxy-(phospho)methylpyrimidine kinase/thiamine-phosphate pyrophosphorylase ThiDE [Shewanella algidipiscicola]
MTLRLNVPPNDLDESLLAASSTPAIVWTIAGSDSGGGAGIQADLATLQDLQCHGCTVITAITAQNSVAVDKVTPVDESTLLAQLNALLSDLPPDAIKMGMVANQAQLMIIAKWLTTALSELELRKGKPIPLIVDPVMVASCGEPLASNLDYSVLSGLVTLLTPNADELAFMNSDAARDGAGIVAATTALAKHLDCNVLAKGGDKGLLWHPHVATDLFICLQAAGVCPLHQGQAFMLSSRRSTNPNHHGSGCTLSTAIAAMLAQGFVMHDAILLAKAYVSQGIAQAEQIGQGAGPLARTGWPKDMAYFAEIKRIESDDDLSKVEVSPFVFPRLRLPLGVYPVVDCLTQLARLLHCGATTVQLRLKVESGIDAQRLETEICAAIALGRRYQAQVFINDHWQLALKHGAYGVHLGQEDLHDADLALIAAHGLALGVSSHGYFELKLAAQLKPSYVALGHIFATTTKQMPSLPQGLVNLTRYAALLAEDLPTVAIGGIDATRLQSVKVTGVDGIAVVRALKEGLSVESAYHALHAAWEEGYGA